MIISGRNLNRAMDDLVGGSRGVMRGGGPEGERCPISMNPCKIEGDRFAAVHGVRITDETG